ncbi:MAG: Ankyrin [Aureobasidium pullulans]|nr:MAG: Ankyrin [Aureobasidium pullulans]
MDHIYTPNLDPFEGLNTEPLQDGDQATQLEHSPEELEILEMMQEWYNTGLSESSTTATPYDKVIHPTTSNTSIAPLFNSAASAVLRANNPMLVAPKHMSQQRPKATKTARVNPADKISKAQRRVARSIKSHGQRSHNMACTNCQKAHIKCSMSEDVPGKCDGCVRRGKADSCANNLRGLYGANVEQDAA